VKLIIVTEVPQAPGLSRAPCLAVGGTGSMRTGFEPCPVANHALRGLRAVPLFLCLLPAFSGVLEIRPRAVTLRVSEAMALEAPDGVGSADSDLQLVHPTLKPLTSMVQQP